MLWGAGNEKTYPCKGYLALVQWQYRPPSALTGVVFAFLIFGLAVILTNFYYPQYHSSLNTISGRLNSVSAGLEFAALVIGLACIMLGEPVVVTWMLFATALLVASDLALRGTGFATRATSEACHFLQGESPCLEFKGMNS